jgi:hypothetical protein
MKMTQRLLLPVLVVTAGGCHDSSPVTPSGAKALTSFHIAGTSTFTAVGQGNQFTATASYSDGSTDNVTKGTIWDVADHSVAQFGLPGLLTSKQPGETTVSARFGQQSQSAHVLVLPAGTHILNGTVREPGFVVSGATVAILDGPSAGLSRMTASDGSYKFYGVAGVVTIRAQKTGYVDQTQQVSVTQDQVLDFTLMPTQPPVGIPPGPYQATFVASPSCTQLPADARTRTYAASFTQDGARLDVTLTGPGLNAGTPPTQMAFTGRVLDKTVTFQLNSPTYSYYYAYYFTPGPGTLLDQLSPMRYVSISGTGTGAITGSGIAGTLAGAMIYIEAPNGLSEHGQMTTNCAKADHQFAFSSAMTTSSKRTR